MQGVNLAQFKLSTHQLSRFVDIVTESLVQWEELISSLGIENVSKSLSEAVATSRELESRLAAILEASSRLEDTESSDITITPL